MSKDVIQKIAGIKQEIKENFKYIDNPNDLPDVFGGSMIEKMYLNPKKVFHFLEFILESTYVDLNESKEIVYVDDKTNWEFFIKTDAGFLRVYDWKETSVSIGSVGERADQISKELLEKARLLKHIIDENLSSFIDFRKEEAKQEMEMFPLDNFMSAFVSLNVLFEISLEENKKGTGLIESLILYVSLVDTMLRYCILLTRINKRKSKKIDKDLPELFCQVGKEYLSERRIFAIGKEEINFLSYDKNIFFEQVNKLYDERNKAVHRYAITNFQYNDIMQILEKYLHLRDILFEIIRLLEKEQAEMEVGFITKSDLSRTDTEVQNDIYQAIERKINPAIITKELPNRESMFGEKYKDGVNPKLRKVIKKYEKEMKENYKWEKTSENTFELKQKKLQ